MRATLIEWGLKILAYLCLGPFLLALACADRIKPKKKDGSRSALPEAVPQEAERPHPWPLETDREKELRIAYVMRRADVESFQQACERVRKTLLDAEINALVGDVREGDTRG